MLWDRTTFRRVIEKMEELSKKYCTFIESDVAKQGKFLSDTVTNDMPECLVDNEFNETVVGIDGDSKNTYAKYRRNGNFDKVIENISKLIEIKKLFVL